MGVFSSCHSLNQLKMIKSIVFACLAVAAYAEPEAKAEADPALLYSAGYGGYPYSLGAYTYGAYPYGIHAIGKREAEPKADAAYFYGRYPYAYGYSGYPYRFGYPYAYGK